jgi:hypothetical protein
VLFIYFNSMHELLFLCKTSVLPCFEELHAVHLCSESCFQWKSFHHRITTLAFAHGVHSPNSGHWLDGTREEISTHNGRRFNTSELMKQMGPSLLPVPGLAWTEHALAWLVFHHPRVQWEFVSTKKMNSICSNQGCRQDFRGGSFSPKSRIFTVNFKDFPKGIPRLPWRRPSKSRQIDATWIF